MGEGLRRTSFGALALAVAACAPLPAGKSYEEQRSDYFYCRDHAARQQGYDDAFTTCMRARAHER